MQRRVLIIDDHPLVATGLRLALDARGWTAEVATGTTQESILDRARSFEPDCVLLDLHLGHLGTGLDLIEPLVALGSKVVMLTAESSHSALAECLEAGAVCWVGKDVFVDNVVTTLEEVMAGGSPVGRTLRESLLADLRASREARMRAVSCFDALTDRERCVLRGLMDGLSADEIAESDFVALSTVRSQIRAVLRKLGVGSQLAAVALAYRSGWNPTGAAADEQLPRSA